MTRVRVAKDQQPNRPLGRTVQRRPARTSPPTGYDDEEVGQEESEEEYEEAPVRLKPAAPRAPLHGHQRSSVRDDGREPVHERRRTRRRKATQVEDIFYIPVDEIPEGLSYEWKRYSVIGQEDPFYLAQLREQGWEPVPPKRHPSWVPPGYSQPHIIKGGMILMDRPIELTEEARDEQRVLARRQVREAEARLGRTPGNTMQRNAPRIEKEIGRMMPAEAPAGEE